MNKNKKIYFLFIFIVFIIGSIFLGIRYSKNYFKKKINTKLNTQFSKDFSGNLNWDKLTLNIFTNTINLHNVCLSFSGENDKFPLDIQLKEGTKAQRHKGTKAESPHKKNENSYTFQVKKIKIRYSPIQLLKAKKIYLPSVFLEDLRANLTSFPSQKTKKDFIRIFFSQKETITNFLYEVSNYLKKCTIRKGSFTISFPEQNQEIILNDCAFQTILSPKKNLAIQFSVPYLKKTDSDIIYSISQADFLLTEHSLNVNSFLLSNTDREKVFLQGKVYDLATNTPKLDLFYRVNVDAQKMKSFFPDMPDFSSVVILKGIIKGPIEHPVFSGSLIAKKVVFENKEIPKIQKVKIQYQYENAGILIDSFLADFSSGQIQGQGKIDLKEKKFSFEAASTGSTILKLPSFAHINNSPWKEIFIKIQQEYTQEKGKISFEGKFTNQQIIGKGRISLRLESSTQPSKDWIFFKSDIVLLEKEIQFERILFEFGEKNKIQCAGVLNLSDEVIFQNCSFHAQCTLSQEENLWKLFLENNKINGDLLVNGQIEGTFSNPKISCLLSGQNILFKRYQAQSFNGKINYSDRQIILSDFNIKENNTEILLNGSISTLNGQGILHALSHSIYYDDLEQILGLRAPIIIEGKMSCSADFHILPNRQKKFFGSGKIDTKKWSIASNKYPFVRQYFDSVNSKFEVDKDSFRLFETEGELDRQKVHAELILYPKHNNKHVFYFSSEEFDLSLLDLVKSKKIPLKGKSSFKVQGKGKLSSGTWEGYISTQHPVYNGFQWNNADVQLNLQAANYHGKLNLEENSFSFHGTIQKGIPYQLTGVIPNMKIKPDLSFLLKKNCKLDKFLQSIELSGQLTASGHLGNLKKSEGKLSIQKAVINTPFSKLSARNPFEVNYHQSKINLFNGHFKGEDTEVKISGKADWGETLNMHFSGNFPLNFIPMGKQNVFSKPQGAVHFDLSLTGPFGNPKFSGIYEISDGVIHINALNRRLEEIQGEIFLSDNTLKLMNITAKYQEGRAKLSGQLSLKGFEIFSGDISFKGENILYVSPKKDKFLLFGDLNWQGNKDHSTLKGEISVKEGRYTRNVGILQSLLTKKRKIEIPENNVSFSKDPSFDWLSNLTYDLQLSIPHSVWVKSAFLNAEISLSTLNIKGNFFQPYAVGQIITQNGVILLGGSKFSIISGIIDLHDPDQRIPTLEVLANSDIDEYQITLNISGDIEDPQIRLSATPYLSQSDILKMIALGISSDGKAEQGLVGQMADATSYLISDIFGKELTSFSGIDLFRTKILHSGLFQLDLLKLQLGEETGAIERITMGRDITTRLQLKYSIPADRESGNDVTEAEYKLSDYIRLIGSQDDLGTYSLDLNFSLDF